MTPAKNPDLRTLYYVTHRSTRIWGIVLPYEADGFEYTNPEWRILNFPLPPRMLGVFFKDSKVIFDGVPKEDVVQGGPTEGLFTIKPLSEQSYKKVREGLGIAIAHCEEKTHLFSYQAHMCTPLPNYMDPANLPAIIQLMRECLEMIPET